MVFNYPVQTIDSQKTTTHLFCFVCPGDAGNAGTSYKLADLNMEAKESEEEEDDDIDWEEG